MKIAVIEHRLQDDVHADVEKLVEATKQAVEQGAEVVFYPHVLSVTEHGAHEALAAGLAGLPGTRLIPRIGVGVHAQVFPVTDEIPVVGPRLGKAALIHGDACMNEAVLERVAAGGPCVLVMTPMSESDLQAEALLELALGLSESAAGLVIVAECTGAEPGDPGHGGSAIVLLGEVLAEAMGEQGDVLVAEVPEPVSSPEPPEPVPEVPTILAQRLANHEGRRLDMGYPADLTDGPGPR